MRRRKTLAVELDKGHITRASARFRHWAQLGNRGWLSGCAAVFKRLERASARRDKFRGATAI